MSNIFVTYVARTKRNRFTDEEPSTYRKERSTTASSGFSTVDACHTNVVIFHANQLSRKMKHPDCCSSFFICYRTAYSKWLSYDSYMPTRRNTKKNEIQTTIHSIPSTSISKKRPLRHHVKSCPCLPRILRSLSTTWRIITRRNCKFITTRLCSTRGKFQISC